MVERTELNDVLYASGSKKIHIPRSLVDDNPICKVQSSKTDVNWHRKDVAIFGENHKELCENCEAAWDEMADLGNPQITQRQREILRIAYQMGFFEVPRDSTLEDVSDELNISHQAASERIRRAMSQLAETTL